MRLRFLRVAVAVHNDVVRGRRRVGGGCMHVEGATEAAAANYEIGFLEYQIGTLRI